MERVTAPLGLREYRESDWAAVTAYQSDPRYLVFSPLNRCDENEARRFVDMFLRQQQQLPRWQWQFAIDRRTDGRLIGSCGLRLNEPGSRIGDIGYELDPAYWGQGFATEVAAEILRFGFEELHLHRVWAWCLAENVASARVLERLGFRPEGRQREHELVKGRWHDRLLFGLLASERAE